LKEGPLLSFTTFKGRGWAAFFLAILARTCARGNLSTRHNDDDGGAFSGPLVSTRKQQHHRMECTKVLNFLNPNLPFLVYN
jgi:hypothetical protein